MIGCVDGFDPRFSWFGLIELIGIVGLLVFWAVGLIGWLV